MFDKDFYPTPADLIDRMLGCIKLDNIETALEPSAGRGGILERIAKRTEYGRKVKLDAIESDPELRLVLAGKGYKPIADDFLAFTTFRNYDLVIMNPPFSDGDKHLLKAIALQADGGHVVCLLNAETIRNPYTNTRRELAQAIERYQGTVEYMQGSFSNAARQTDVEVALVHLDIPHTAPHSDILQNLAKAAEQAEDAPDEAADLVGGDYINAAVQRYGIEVSAGLKLISEYEALRPVLSRSFSDKDRSMLELIVDGDHYGDLRNTLVDCTRMKYWQELFQTREFGQLFTSKTRDDYKKRIDDLARYEFTVSNVKQMQIELSQSMLGSLDDSIVRLFDEFSSQYWDEQSNNIHYYNGWKTNKAYVVNKKVITRVSAFDSWDCKFDSRKAYDKMSDIHKVFSYLDGNLSSNDDCLRAPIDAVRVTGQTRGVQLPYCKVDFYKKGTAHITFKDERLLKKFNLIGSQRKGWLPPAYGKAAYTDLGQEQRDVVDSFEGRESYEETHTNYQYYAVNANPMLAIGAGEVAA